ncbi:response regulator transcription factor [bacterium]|nr:response regulator transcription factor [bacterium]
MSIKVVLADDHAVVIDGIKAVVERKAGKDIEIIGVASNGEQVLKIAEKTPVDVFVLDISMPVMNGIETTERLMEKDPKSRIIILSMHDDSVLVEKALKCGAKGYLLKESATEEVVSAINEVYDDRCYLSPKISTYLVEGFLGKQGKLKLSPQQKAVYPTAREKEILKLIVEGQNSREISLQLNISLNTVLRHRNNIMKKLNIHNQAALIRYALKEGIANI